MSNSRFQLAPPCDTSLSLPCECQYIQYDSTDYSYIIFGNHVMGKYIAIGLILICYSIPLIFFWRIRHSVALKARSPLLILLALLFLCADSVSNTYIFSGFAADNDWRTTCSVSVMCTTVFFFGVLLVYYLRMHRIEQVFSCYQQYLEQQL